ncbi:MAG: hypothetical protein E7675_01080 [Ruminococcaceae bacterium]|nr:hypothetical protein [Oscillospiraceae bacterium]
MKKSLALVLALLMLLSTLAAALPMGVFASDSAEVITETAEDYTGTLGYGGYIVRSKSDGSIMLSPFISQLRAAVNAGANLADYTIEMTFSVLTGDNGGVVHTFDTVSATINKSNGQYFDIYLNGSKGTTGFCPTAGKFYDIEVKIYKGYGTASQTLELYGTYKSAEIPTSISSSNYYTPTPTPVVGQQITETKDDYTGSYGYNGGIRVKSDKSIMFSPYITELMALYNAGESMSDYTALLTFELLTGVDGEVEHKFDTFSASLTRSNGYFDIYLNGSKGNSGFCPTADNYYDITVEIYKNYGTADATLAMYGTYKSAYAPANIADSTYYVPTPTMIQITETTEAYTGSKWYSSGIRKNSSGLIMFSPFISELRADCDKGASADTYKVVADFALLDGEGKVVHTFENITLKPNKSSNGKYFDIPLQSATVDCGFCPTADSTYNVYVEIYDSEGVLKYYGEYKKITAASAIAQSNYYVPTAVPGAPIEYNISLSYSFNNALAGSAAGKIFVTVDKPGYFAIGWGDKDGKALSVKTGDKTLTYSELNSFVLTESNGGSYVENVIGFTAIPYGAEYVIITDSADNVLKTLALPENKLLKDEAPEYTFGVVSDIHFNYFFDSTKETDYAEGAFDTALEFYKAAGVELVAAVGDYSLYAEEESYKEYYEAVAKSGLLVIACGGNHELYASLDVMFGEDGYWRTYMNEGIYDGSVDGVLDIADNGIDFTYRIPGVDDAVFISLSQWYWDGHSATQEKLVEPQQLEWLEEQFELHKDETVYFMFHTYLSDDDGENIDGQGDLKNPGGYSYNGHYNTYTSDEKVLRGLLTKYDNVIWYNGHSHYEYSMQMFNENLNIYDYQGTTATMVHVPSLTNPRTVGVNSTSYSSLYGEASQGALQFVYDGYEIMNGVDLWGEEILSYACYIIYTDKTDIVDGGTIEGTEIEWTYNAQLNSLRIVGNGAIPAFDEGEAPYAKYAEDILSLYVGGGITAIGEGAFADLVNLDKAELKEGVATVGADAFAGTVLTTLILPESLVNIADGAFADVDVIANIVYGGTAEKWAQLSKGNGNEALDGSATFRKVVITFVAGNVTVEYEVKVGDVPSYPEIPTKDHEDDSKHYLFTGWTDGTKNYLPTDKLPKATANATYTALFANEVERYVSGTLSNGSITWTLDRKAATLTISGTGAMPDFADSAAQPWAAYGSEIVKVIVKSGVTVVGKNAFSRLAVLTTVVIEEGVTTLQMDALAYNEALMTLTLPLSLTVIGQGTVYQTNNITTIYYGGSEEQWNSFCEGITTYYNDNLKNAKNVIYAITPSVGGFVEVDGVTKYEYADGTYASGWFEIDGVVYYASLINGEVFKNDKKIGGKYYFWNDETGFVLASGFVELPEGTVCYENGVQVYGWRHEDGTGPKVVGGISEQYSHSPEGLYYFLSTTGYMVTDATYKIGGYVREFNDDNTVKAVNGLQTIAGELYYYENGVKQTGWKEIDGVTYYFRASDDVYGRAATKWMYIGDRVYYFCSSSSATPYALKDEGTIGGIEYTYSEEGYILYNGFVNVDFANAANSNAAASIQKRNSTTRYYVDGEMQTGWQQIDGLWYYFYAIGSENGSGYLCNETRTIGGVTYVFTSQGICLNK